MKRFSGLPLLLMAVLGVFAVKAVVEAAPPAIDPTFEVPNRFDLSGTGMFPSFFMNRNQIAVRLTGREYNSHIVNGQGHYPGSTMRFLEDLLNTTVLNGSSTVSGTVRWGLAQNYVDLLLKRIFDADTRTALDYDTQTFAYVDGHNPAFRVPTLPSGNSTTDTNGDGNFYSRQVSDLIRSLCLPIPLIGNDDFCLNASVVNISHWGDSAAGSAPGMVTAGGIVVNNVGARMLDFDNYVTSDVTNSTHVLLASYPNRTFDNELGSSPTVGCNSPEDLSAFVKCDQTAYRDDDDGLYFEIQLQNFSLDVLFQPPATYSVTTAVGDAGDYALNITDLEDVPSKAVYSYNDGMGNSLVNAAAQTYFGASRAATNTVPGCQKQILGVDVYDAACDLSNYVKAYGQIFIPRLKIQGSVRIISSYTDLLPDTGPNAVTDTINLGVTVQYVQADVNAMFQFNPGPYCQSRTADATDPRGYGQDGLGNNYLYTDDPNNCITPADGQVPNVVNISDDSTYMVSSQFTEILPYIRTELQAKMTDYFDPSTNPGFFFGPTRLIDLNGMLGGISFDIPWNPGTDYLKLQLALDSAVDSPKVITGVSMYATKTGASYYRGDSIDEFWADWNGVMMPFSGGLGLEWLSDLTKATEVQSCVTKESAYTGYVDGYKNSLKGGSDADNPSVSRPIPRLKTEWTGNTYDPSGEEYDSALLSRKIPNVNGKAPFAGPSFTPAGVTAADNSTYGSYALGLAIHQNLLSKALYEAIIDGVLCIDIDAKDPDNLLGTSASSILNTKLLGFFIPYLADNFPNMDMAVRVVPYLQNPRNLNWPANNGGKTYAANIKEFKNIYSNYVTQENSIPRIITGGINQYNFLKDRYVGAITTSSPLFNNPITAGAATCAAGNINCPQSVKSYGMWPDFSIVIPHLILEFFVWDESTFPAVKKRAFALDIGLNIGLNIDVVQDPGIKGAKVTSALDPVTSVAGFQRPAYSGTNFPIGCGANTAYPCEIKNVPSRMVLFLGGIADPEINAVLTYDEISNAVTDGTTGAVAGEAFLNGGVTDYTVFENAISNLLGMLFSSEIGVFAEIGIDPAAWLNLPLVLSVPYIGPSYVASLSSGSVKTAGLGCGAAGNMPCMDPSGLNPSTMRDISDNDLNGFGDYLVIAAGVDMSYITSDYLLRLADGMVVENLFYSCKLTTVNCNSEYYQNSLASLLGLSPDANSFYSDGGLPRGYVSPKTYIKGVEKAYATETIIAFEGELPGGNAKTLTYSWRVDGGLWTPFMPWTKVRIPGLLEGNHVFEVKARDTKGNVEYSPARIAFVVDSVAPRVTLAGDRVQGSNVAFQANVRDAESSADNVRVSYKLDSGDWSRFSYDKLVSASLAEGRHTVDVRAIDEAGNISVPTVMNFNVQDAGFGCSVAANSSSSPLDFILLMLLPLGFFWRRRS